MDPYYDWSYIMTTLRQVHHFSQRGPANARPQGGRERKAQEKNERGFALFDGLFGPIRGPVDFRQDKMVKSEPQRRVVRLAVSELRKHSFRTARITGAHEQPGEVSGEYV